MALGNVMTVGADSAECLELAELAPAVVRSLYDLGDRVWPSRVMMRRKKWVFAGPDVEIAEDVPPRYKVLLRRYDLSTLKPNWRLECAGPVEFFDWNASGRILGSYGIRCPVFSIAPVRNEVGQWAGFGLNCRRVAPVPAPLQAVDARVDCRSYVSSRDPDEVLKALGALDDQPQFEESRPGMEPTDEYVALMHQLNMMTYFVSRGVNQYAPPGWNAESLRKVFQDPNIRAVWLGHPDKPTAVPEPMEH